MNAIIPASKTFGSPPEQEVTTICDDNNNESIEEKVKVDRRKFEALLANEDPDFGDADKFFSGIMSEFPSVLITWPPKLRAGTRSRKDPHIKISGIPSMVESARIKILDALDPRRDRVTLKVDIDWSTHSHIIGKAGASIQKVMDKTGCHVHFPDANRTAGNDKSNQVSIAGSPSSVKEARSAIRDLLPVIVCFTLLLKPGNRSVFLDRLNCIIQLIERMTKLQITVRFNAQTYSKSDLPLITILVRGIFGDYKLIEVGTNLLLNFMDDFFVKEDIIYQINTEISGNHHIFVIGHEESNIKWLMRTTETVITFPDQGDSLDIISRLMPSSTPQPRKSTVNIKGSTIISVLTAFELLELSLPITLTFDLDEGYELKTSTIEILSRNWNVGISVKPKPKQKAKTIWVKAAEKDEWKLFEVRRYLLKENEPRSGPPAKVCETPESDHSIWRFDNFDLSPQSDLKSVALEVSPTAHFDKAPGAERFGRINRF